MLDRLTSLRDLGVRLAVDDFGAFSSSLGSLRWFAAGELKVDRSVVADLAGSAAMAGAAINLGHALGLEAVAEGVETPAQVEELTRLGCDLAQGYYWMRPAPAAEVEGWLVATAAAHPSPGTC